MNSQKYRGFSLVELSIVLVILGLLTGGILTGQSLIKAAELRSVVTETQQFAAATNSFKSKYLALPGDMTNATLFWDRLSTCPAGMNTGGTVATTGTCNGNGIIDLGAASQAGEIFLYWQHLAKAGLITGNYTGIAGSATIWHSILQGSTQNVPSSKFSNGAWNVLYHVGAHPIFFEDASGILSNDLMLGALTVNSYPEAALLTPEEAWNIDTKIDDGQAGRGKVTAGRRGASGCSTAADSTDYNATYRLEDKGIRCALLFKDIL